VNHLSTALVSLLLLPRMLETARTHGTHPRLVVVTSETHFWADLDAEVRAAPSLLGVLSSRAYCVDQCVFFSRAPPAHADISPPQG
jgi:retinol dehydrogenase-12